MGFDPMHFLALEGADRVVAQVVLRRAVDEYNQDRNQYLEAMKRAVRDGVASAFR